MIVKMAMYLKRTSKLFDISRPQATTEMNLRDLMCPVCRGILIEPVTLPCTHNLCLRCLKGTFKHNSLSCPLCRVRVGSWLRTATKSESLVNGALWDLIRSRFAKEIADKHNDDVTVIDCNSGGYSPKILSAAGEIRREYEMQLQIAEVEMRRQRESERIANEELIRKIQEEEEKQKLAQLAQDQLMAKKLAKKQLLETDRNVEYYESLKKSTFPHENDYPNHGAEKLASSMADNMRIGAPSLLHGHEGNSLLDMNQTIEPRKSNLNLLSKIQAERLALGVKSSILNKPKQSKSCGDYSTPCHSIVTLKHQTMTMLTNKGGFNYISEPSCSHSKIYGDQNEEELRVPSDVLNSNSHKKSLGIEICVQSQTTTVTNDEKRIGSAQSAGSHDSINPEIHHFKPIKAIPRTPLKISQDGRQIDPKLLRVVPILKRISNAISKPPSQHMRRMIGCSWSAFKVTGRAKQDAKYEFDEADWKSPGNPIQNHLQLTKLQTRPQVTETARKLDLVPDVSFDTNKNYDKSINRLLNGTKVNKKSIVDNNDDKVYNEDGIEILEPNKLMGRTKNGLLGKRKQKNLTRNMTNKDEACGTASCYSSIVDTASSIDNENVEERRIEEDELSAVENIAERIKRRKVTLDTFKKNDKVSEKLAINRKWTRSRTLSKRVASNCVEVEKDEEEEKEQRKDEREKIEKKSSLKSQRKDLRRNGARGRKNKNAKVEMPIDTESVDRTDDKRRRRGKRITRNSLRMEACANNGKKLDGEIKSGIEEIVDADFGERVMQDQERIEKLVMQEKQDYELARRLQAKFNEMERISGRTRGSRRALERSEIAINTVDNGKMSKLNTKLLSDESAVIPSTTAETRRHPKRR